MSRRKLNQIIKMCEDLERDSFLQDLIRKIDHMSSKYEKWERARAETKKQDEKAESSNANHQEEEQQLEEPYAILPQPDPMSLKDDDGGEDEDSVGDDVMNHIDSSLEVITEDKTNKEEAACEQAGPIKEEKFESFDVAINEDWPEVEEDLMGQHLDELPELFSGESNNPNPILGAQGVNAIPGKCYFDFKILVHGGWRGGR